MLDIAFSCLAGNILKGDAARARDLFYVDAVENRRYRPEEYPALFVAHAAANTVLTALVDDHLTPIDDSQDDESLDAEAYEPSYLIASAFAGGLNDSANASVQKRREFWRWYLDEAIPKTLSASEA